MTYRQTFVIEYETSSDAPPVGANMEMLGGKLIAVQFDDALEELEAMDEAASPDTIARAHQIRQRMKAERQCSTR